MKASRSGFVALLGAPNAGKSTLLNALVGTKLSIVSPKVQTTRTRITGIAIEGKAQIIFIDTPGIFGTPKRRLERAMVEAAWAAVEGADAIALLVDAKEGITAAVGHIVAGLRARKRKAVLILNKVDATAKPTLLD
ncbi:MAG TPA: GTPase Era, partial [Sphingomonadales bacterium]|nr:GTPase Era [Sphingomonadales bacterium]